MKWYETPNGVVNAIANNLADHTSVVVVVKFEFDLFHTYKENNFVITAYMR
jgi:hypothetical protein